MKKLCAAVAAASMLMALVLTGCSQAGGRPSADVPNPVVEYDSVEKLDQALGFSMIQLPADGYEPKTYAAINKEIGQIVYGLEDAEINVRMAEGTGDISGVNGAEYQNAEWNGIQAHAGSYGDIMVAWFEHAGYAYAASATGLTEEAFEEILKEMTAFVSRSGPEEQETE